MDETSRLSSLADGVHFEQSPDPLLSLRTPPGPDLYAPGNLGEFARGFTPAEAHLRHDAVSRAHPSFGAGLAPASRLHASRRTALLSGKRWVAVVLALIFGTLGAHNFYLGRTDRAVVNVLVWFAGTLGMTATGSIFMMLPIIALVLVECAQIVRRTGAYADLR
ncbi:TM2 domain-containing protein [Trueperella sp.]|uniref:TM2 domain-containing protein n=1 Tax=Trueperella sp. TaxID=2699835 RepID=UPI0022EA2AC2|nr:TM2 domain-containing protein [Trueperella sp.]